VHRSVESWLERLEVGAFRTHGLEYDRFAALKPEEDPLTAAYNGGLDLAEDMVPCRTRSEVLLKARGWSAWGLSLLARPVPGYVYAYVFDLGNDEWSSAVSFDTSMLTYETSDLPRGEWLRGLLVSLVAALGSEVCGYGADRAYRLRYEALDPSVIIQRLRAGELFTMPYPNFHAISAKLVKVEEMADLLDRLPRSQFLQYRLATAGYHILSILP
jgi:hypothetical protein